MSTFRDARILLLESYLDGVIDDDQTFSKNLEIPYEISLLLFSFAIMTSKYKNTKTKH